MSFMDLSIYIYINTYFFVNIKICSLKYCEYLKIKRSSRMGQFYTRLLRSSCKRNVYLANFMSFFFYWFLFLQLRNFLFLFFSNSIQLHGRRIRYPICSFTIKFLYLKTKTKQNKTKPKKVDQLPHEICIVG